MIAIIDYDAGNVKSVQKALAYLHEDTILTRDPKQLLAAEKVILPGVGAFGDAMGKLKEYGLIDVISEIVDKNTPFLGICLGLQLLFESSEESPGVEGLGLLKGKILRIPDGVAEDKRPLKIPHIGWNSLSFPQKGRLRRKAGSPAGLPAFSPHSSSQGMPRTASSVPASQAIS